MSEVPADIRYTRTHEWAKLEDNEITVGITDHAQSALGDIVFVELPEVGQEYRKEQEGGVVESVKAASDLYVPISGEVTEINSALEEQPSKVNEDPYQDGWLYKIRPFDLGEWDELLDANDYQETLEIEQGA